MSSSSWKFRRFVGIPLVILYLLTFAFGWLEVTLIILTVEKSLDDSTQSTFPGARESTEKVVHVMLILCSSTLGLIFLTRLQTLWLLVRSMFSSQRSYLLKATENNDVVKSEGILQAVRNELDFLVKMVEALDGFTNRSSRMTIVVDGLDIMEQRKVLQVLDTVQHLFSGSGNPFIILIAIDPHIIIKAIELNIKETFAHTSVGGYSYLRNVVHLPFFLQYTGTRRIKTAQAIAAKHRDLSSADSEARFRSQAKLTTESSENVVGCVGSSARMGPLELHRMFLTDDYFSDVNPRSMRRLMNVVYVMGRLLKAFKIDFNWHHLSVWVNVTEQWPYRASWLVHAIEHSEEQVDCETPLLGLYQRIKHQIPEKIDTSFSDMDRDENKLLIFLKIHKKILNVRTILTFFPFTINLDPYLRKIIQEYINQRDALLVNMHPEVRPSCGGLRGKGHQKQSKNWRKESLRNLDVIPSIFHQRSLISLTVPEVGLLLDSITGMTKTGRDSCKEIIIQQNINGTVLQHCHVSELKDVLKINFGDWEILKMVLLDMRKKTDEHPSANNQVNITKNSSMLTQMELEREAVSGLVSCINEDARDDVEMEDAEVTEKMDRREIGKIYYASSRCLSEATSSRNVLTSSRSIPRLSIEEADGASNDNILMVPRHSRRQRSKSENPPVFDEKEEMRNTAKFYLEAD